MKISDVPMLTADECEIKVNGIVYDFTWNSGYNFKGDAKWSVNSYRVISVNESARHFRLRSQTGCEHERSFAKGCDSRKIYGTLAAVKAAIKIEAQEDIDSCKAKIIKVENTKKAIDTQLAAIKSLKESDIKEPKAVKQKAT